MRLSPGHGADEDAVVARGQVFALDQEEAEIAGEIGVLEIGLVHRPGREHANPGIVLAVEAGQLVLQRLEERRVAEHPQAAIDVGNPVGQREPVFQRIAGTGRRLGAVAQHPPAAIGAARDVDGIEAQMRAAGRRHVGERPHEVRAAGHECGGQAPLADELGRPVNVGEHRLDEARPRDQRGLQLLPLAGLDDERNMGQGPRPVGALGVLIDAVEHAGFAQVTVARGEPARQFLAPEAGEAGEQLLPMRPHRAVIGHHLVVDARQWPVIRQQLGDRIGLLATGFELGGHDTKDYSVRMVAAT